MLDATINYIASNVLLIAILINQITILVSIANLESKIDKENK